MKKTYPYNVYLPKDYTKEKKNYPVVIYLHGSSQRGNDLNMVKRSGLPRLAEEGLEIDYILIVPQCPSGRIWSSEDWFGDVWQEVQNKFKVDINRVYLVGVSMGGGGAFDVARQYPTTFAALVPLCAWASSSKGLCAIKHVPIWTFHGTEDNVVSITETDEKYAVLKGCKGNIKYTRLEGKGHSIHDVFDPNNEFKVMEWVLEHRLNSQQKK